MNQLRRLRQMRRNSRKPALVFTGVVSLALALVFWVGNYIEGIGQGGGRNRGFDGDAVATFAEVSIKEEQDTNYYVRLRYEVQNADGTSDFVNSADYVNEADFEKLEEGGQVSIEYDSETPLNWRLSNPAPIDAPDTDEFTYSAGYFLLLSVVSFGLLFLMLKTEGDTEE